ncbi:MULTISPECIES: AraC family transcriptional regulator [Enterobacteriaceae]|uniref:AraC family transcriptional regulator n=1 Tax=Enterobacteriaceae TaxID=543 RepID=UPI0012AE0C2F|nr:MULTISPECIES: AraC family transcriptional regulator [Enterobacteriaceae]MRT51892.1 helix-turn-helix domain-containing protein [Raoultella sp. RIT712]QNK08798.1 helix-turn-helix transcriptional regulator [Enterobacter sp. JUb54]
MTQSLISMLNHDRLTAFLKAFPLVAMHCDVAECANLLIIDVGSSGEPTHLLYRARTSGKLPAEVKLCAAARIDFGGTDNPLVGALPDEICFSMADMPQLFGLSQLLVTESDTVRCGGGTVRAHLCGIVVVLVIRQAIATGTVDGGLLAGLAHPKLYLSLVAMHDNPEQNWKISDLSAITGLSRAQYIEVFRKIVGQTPGVYLTSWRLSLGRAKLREGHSVKTVASMVGFGSAAAFSRAFTRKFGHSPGTCKSQRERI